MRLEDEIKTKSFRNEIHKLGVNLMYTTNWITNAMQETMEEFGITMQQFNILRILRGQSPNPCTIQLLKKRMLDKQSDASRLVDRLCAKGLSSRQICPNDRRKMDVSITQAGLDLLERMEPAMIANDKLFQGISEQEAKLVNDILDRLRDNRPAAED